MSKQQNRFAEWFFLTIILMVAPFIQMIIALATKDMLLLNLVAWWIIPFAVSLWKTIREINKEEPL